MSKKSGSSGGSRKGSPALSITSQESRSSQGSNTSTALKIMANMI
jgi:hypothetical protein